MTTLFAAVHESGCGTSQTSCGYFVTAAVGAKADVDRKRSVFRVVPIGDIAPLLDYLVGTSEDCR